MKGPLTYRGSTEPAAPAAVPTAALSVLTRRQREAMMARLGDGGSVVPQEDIATRLGIRQSSVSRRLNGGLRRLELRGYSQAAANLRARLRIT